MRGGLVSMGRGGRGGGEKCTSIVVIFGFLDGVVEGSWLVGWLVGRLYRCVLASW